MMNIIMVMYIVCNYNSGSRRSLHKFTKLNPLLG